MRRIAIIAGVVLLLAVCGILFVSAQMERKTSDAPVKVGMVMIGTRENSSWNASHWQGIQDTAQQLNLALDCEENVSTEDCPQVLDKMVRNGCRIIISTSIDFEKAVDEAAQSHPEIYFFQATGTQSHGNLSSYMGRMYQMRYLAGLAAGRQTKTHCVGYVTTMPIPEVVRGIDAFTLGVRKADPEATVYVKYTQDWSDDAKARQATTALLDTQPQIDVLGMHLDTYGPLEIAEQRGVYSIGCNTAERTRCPQTFLTATVWNWSIFYTKYVREALNNKFAGTSYLVGADAGIVSLAPLEHSGNPDIAQFIANEKGRLVNGEYDVFYGPIRDTAGQLRVAAGENLSDKTLFEELDWYVEGVVVLP